MSTNRYVGAKNEDYIQIGRECLHILLKVIHHPLYSMNNYVLIWDDWLSCDPLSESHDSQSPHILGDWLSCDYHMIANHPI